MPIKFACEHCDQVLRVSSKKAGRRAKCPSCQNSLTVPTLEQAAEMAVKRRAAEKAREPADETERSTLARDDSVDGVSAGEAALDPFAQFTVYNDSELVYERPEMRRVDDRPVDMDKVAVPRKVIYMQGVLLGLVAIVCFTLGVVVGVATNSGGTPAVALPCVVSGKVSFVDSSKQKTPDTGAVVIIVPKEAKPDGRPNPTALSPDSQPPARESAAFAAIRDIGGDYRRVDAEGRFELDVMNSRSYYVLYISNRAVAGDKDQLTTKQRAQIGDYFLPVEELIGNHKVKWIEARVSGQTMTLDDVAFD